MIATALSSRLRILAHNMRNNVEAETVKEAAAEIERLLSDIALLGPVTTPVSGELCASCIEPMVAHWTYCPYCGAQGRLNAAGEKI